MPVTTRTSRSVVAHATEATNKANSRGAKPSPPKAPPAKRQKKETAPQPKVGSVPAPVNVVGSYTPALLPPVLSFDLQTAMSHLSRADPRFTQLFQHLPCRPFVNLEAVDPYKTLVTSIIGQQVSWMAARAINARFKALFGFTEENEGFPTPEMVIAQDIPTLRSVGLSQRKTEYVQSLADHFQTGRLSTDLLQNGTDEEISKALIDVRGIGQWTVDMFMIFSLRRPDVLAVGDLGVQKGLLKWALAAHGALERKPVTGATPKKKGKGKAAVKNEKVVDQVDVKGEGEVDTFVRDATPIRQPPSSSAPPTPITPGPSEHTHRAALHTPATPLDFKPSQIPPTPATPTAAPEQVAEVPPNTLPTLTTEEMLQAPIGRPEWDAHRAVPLPDGLGVDVLKSRLNGKKVKGGQYLTPQEMEALTESWKPYRSLPVFYMWPVAGES
ncbi:hypothetical protein B9479_000524 [Cryptococcus floricola]|uniref:HhH-GPD domain-containing protein n=1 Tax=Cryptococcus floricola TaxID=2591691 RepID=A0A5D3B6P9_9TREE|nr:hypothetical protein B9479_000524 [Cryptococcus floricola]